MSNLTFHELVARLEKELYRLYYTESSINYYRQMWRRIAGFLDTEGLDHFTEEAGLRFLDSQYNFFVLEKAGKLTQSNINTLRVILMLGDFQQHGSVLRRYYKQKELLQTNEFKGIFRLYKVYCQQKEYSNATINHYRKIAEKFLSFVESQGIWRVADITAKHTAGYIKTLLGYGYKTVELELCGMRSLLRYLHDNQLHPQDLAQTIPAIRARKQSRIPSVWTLDNVTKLLDAVDRGNPAGKRDYAILLLVTRLGLRTRDIKHLKLSNLNWRDNRIDLVQSKTSRVVSLPLLPEIGWAIIDYLKNGRPATGSPYVFLRCLAHLEPFSDEDRLHQIIVKYMKLAKVPISPAKKKGMHSLRHTLASRLLSENTPLPVISDILGHISSDSTAVYLKVDISKLRECALDPDEVFRS